MGKKKERPFVETAPDGSQREWSFAAGVRRMQLFLKLTKAGLSPSEIAREVQSIEQTERAARPRSGSRAGLKVRALIPFCHLTAEGICDAIEADGQLVHEPDDGSEEFRVTLDRDGVRVYSYTTDEEETIPNEQLREYLKRARNT